MIRQKLPTLHESYGVRVHLTDSIPIVFWHTADAMLYMKLVLSDDSCSTCAQKLVVMQQRTRNGIFDSQNTNSRRIELCMLKKLFKRSTTVELYLLIREVLMGCNIVERAMNALYCYLFHLIGLSFSTVHFVEMNCSVYRVQLFTLSFFTFKIDAFIFS